MSLSSRKLKDILDKHKKWSRGEARGQRASLHHGNLRFADLRGADLRGADLQGAYLRGADLQGAYLRGADLQRADLQDAYLQGANLRGADLQSADLQSANLRGANLRGAYLHDADLRGADLQDAYLQGANLRGAYLQPIKTDFFERLTLAKSEVAGLYDALMRGKIDGSAYEGECACFCGTIANLRKEHHKEMTIALKPDPSSPTEVWFLAIRKGDTPGSNVVADITRGWIEDFAKENSIELPKYKLISSLEFRGAFI